MTSKPAVPFSDPSVRLIRRVGIVHHGACGDAQLVWFSRPVVLMGLLAAGIALLLAAVAVLYLVLPSKDRLGTLVLLHLPVIALLAYLLFRLATHRHHIELGDGKLRLVERRQDQDVVHRELDIASIYSVSSAAATASPRATLDSQVPSAESPFALYPEILVCAEPRNLSIKGPRRFRHKEAELILAILNHHTTGKTRG